MPKLLVAAAVLAGSALAVKTFQDKQKKEKKEEPKKNGGGSGLGWGKK